MNIMKKILAILMTVCLMVSVICVTAVPVSAAADYVATLTALHEDGEIWAIGICENFEDAWNDAVEMATDDDWMKERGFDRIIVDFYDDWNAETNGEMGTGHGFMDGIIYVPGGAKITINLNGHTINRSLAKDGVVFVENGADLIINNGTIIGSSDAETIYIRDDAKVSLKKVNVTGNGAARAASIFGEGSLSLVVAILALVVSVASACINFALYKKKAAPAEETNAAGTEDEK